ncbi:MAG: hypothetical protein WBS24_11875 [Terriglobales bacterium]
MPDRLLGEIDGRLEPRSRILQFRRLKRNLFRHFGVHVNFLGERIELREHYFSSCSGGLG